jgi:transcriptional regulator with XRE-family HTH domain
MRPVSAGQIKAARALLDWSQEDLAEKSCVSISTIRTMELGKIPRITTLQDICTTLQDNGLEFTEGEGVRRRDFGVCTLRGVDSCDLFFEDICKTIDQEQKEILVFTKDDKILTRKCGVDFLSNMDRLEALRAVVDIKCLMSDIAKPSFSKPFFPCRMVDHRPCGAVSMFIYGNKYAHVLTDGALNFMAVIYDIAWVAQGERKDFLSLWNEASAISF